MVNLAVSEASTPKADSRSDGKKPRMQQVSSAANETALTVQEPVQAKAETLEKLLSEPKIAAKPQGTGVHQTHFAVSSNRPKVRLLSPFRACKETNKLQIASPLRTSTSSDEFVTIDANDVRLARVQGEAIQA